MSIAGLFRFFSNMLGPMGPPPQTFSPPTADDLEWLRQLRAVARDILAQNYPGAALDGSTADLALL